MDVDQHDDTGDREGRVTVFIDSYPTVSSFLVLGMLEDGEEDMRVRVSLRREENGGDKGRRRRSCLKTCLAT